jgi:hypothetical protein
MMATAALAPSLTSKALCRSTHWLPDRRVSWVDWGRRTGILGRLPLPSFIFWRRCQTAPTLIDVPILFDRKTLEQRAFHWSDWRGYGWVNGKSSESAYRIASWEANPKENRIHIQLELYLAKNEAAAQEPLEKALCPAKLYGLPWSFYKEPIAECAPSILDFFAL